MSASLTPRSLKNQDDTLVIEWGDGVVHQLRWADLRMHCPCASCRTKETEPLQPTSPLQILKPEEAQPTQPVSMTPMGNYAYNITFNDGHNTGIYSFEYLRTLGENLASNEDKNTNN